ncbi:hypothetical protein GCM10027051_10400 [Niabella terrae]
MDLVGKLYYCYVEKLIQMEDVLIRVRFRKGILQLKADHALRELVRKDWAAVEQLSAKLLVIYQALYEEALQINQNSLIIEILGHVYTYRLCLVLRKYFPRGLFRLIAYRSCIIECGESPKDRNRWIWDLLGFYKPMAFLMRNRR